MTRPLPPRLLDVAEGIYVAGTHDVHTALQVVVAEHYLFEDDKRFDDWPADKVREKADEISRTLHELIRTAKTVTFRKAQAMRGNCACGDGHTYDLVYAKPGSPGAMKVVWWV